MVLFEVRFSKPRQSSYSDSQASGEAILPPLPPQPNTEVHIKNPGTEGNYGYLKKNKNKNILMHLFLP